MEVIVTTRIACEPEEVFDHLADSENNPRWQRGMRSCMWTSEPPLRVGSTYDQEAVFLGKMITSSFEVVEFEPGRHIRIATTGGTMPIDVTRDVEALADGSARVTATVRGGPEGPLRIFSPLLRPLIAASVRKDYQRLKTLLESGT